MCGCVWVWVWVGVCVGGGVVCVCGGGGVVCVCTHMHAREKTGSNDAIMLSRL